MLNVLPIPFALAPAPGFFQQYVKFANALTKIGRHNDRLFRDLALHRLTTVADEFAMMATGRIVFHATETWRTAYQHILALAKNDRWELRAVVATALSAFDADKRYAASAPFQRVLTGTSAAPGWCSA